MNPQRTVLCVHAENQATVWVEGEGEGLKSRSEKWWTVNGPLQRAEVTGDKGWQGKGYSSHSVTSQGSWLHRGGMFARSTVTHTIFQCSILREFEKGVWASRFAVLCCERGARFLSARGTLLGGKWTGWQWNDFRKRLEGEQLILWMVARMRGNRRRIWAIVHHSVSMKHRNRSLWMETCNAVKEYDAWVTPGAF